MSMHIYTHVCIYTHICMYIYTYSHPIGLAGFNPYVTTALGFVSGIAFIVLTKKALDQMGELKIGNIYMYIYIHICFLNICISLYI
jgi:hypothetical protein